MVPRVEKAVSGQKGLIRRNISLLILASAIIQLVQVLIYITRKQRRGVPYLLMMCVVCDVCDVQV